MKPTTPAEAVCIEFPDGSTLYGTVVAESTEIDGHVRVVTKTVRVHRGGSMNTGWVAVTPESWEGSRASGVPVSPSNHKEEA